MTSEATPAPSAPVTYPDRPATAAIPSPRKHHADPLEIARGLRQQVPLGRVEPRCLLLQKRRHTGEQRGPLQVADVAQDRDIGLGHVAAQEERPQRRVCEELTVPALTAPRAQQPELAPMAYLILRRARERGELADTERIACADELWMDTRIEHHPLLRIRQVVPHRTRLRASKLLGPPLRLRELSLAHYGIERIVASLGSGY